MNKDYIDGFVYNKPNSLNNFYNGIFFRKFKGMSKILAKNNISSKSVQVNIDVPNIGLFRVKDAFYDENDMSIHIVAGEKIEKPDFTPNDEFTNDEWKVL